MNRIPGLIYVSVDSSGYRVLSVDDAGFPVLAKDTALVFVDPTDTAKRVRFDAGNVTSGQTRVVTWPDYDYTPGVSVVPGTTADPGTGAAIPVTASTSISLTIGAGAETNTLAAPTAVGQRLSLVAGVVGGGTRAVTASAAINQANDTVMTFGAVNDWIVLEGVSINGTLRWRVASNDGVALS